MQSRLSSFIEAWINVLIGFGINFIANLIILPLFLDVQFDFWRFFILGIPYTVISVVRSYAIRRWFNSRIHHAALKLAGATHGQKKGRSSN